MPLPSLLIVLSWSAVAFGGETATRALATPADVSAYVGQVRKEAGVPVLLAAAGPEAERVGLKVAEAAPPGQVRVLRIGYIGDEAEEMRRALAQTGMTCGIRLAATSAGTWSAAAHGKCVAPAATAPAATAPTAAAPTTAPPTPAAVPSTPTTAAPTTAAPTTAAPTTAAPAPAAPATPTAPGTPPSAVSSIPGVGAATGVRVEASPTGPGDAVSTPVQKPALAPLAAPPPPDPAILQSTYDLVALRRVDNPKPREDMPDATWAVRDGRGRTLSAQEFARRTGDLGTERRLDREAATAKGLGLGLAVGGAALAVSGLGLLIAREAGAPDWNNYEPDVGSYDTNAQYFEALAQAEADFRAAEDAHEIKVDDRVWIAGFLTGAGLLTVGVSPFAARGAADRRDVPALYWDPEGADALIEAHNSAVRARIGLPEPTPPAKAVITQPPPDEDDADEDDEQEHEEIEGDPPEDAPRGGAPDQGDAPEGPSGQAPLPRGSPAPGLHLTPVFGIAWTGITGTF